MTEQAHIELPLYRPAQVDKAPPCQLECPNSGDIRRWVGFVAQRDKLGLTREEAFTRSWRVITEVNPFPAVLGRICPHPCQTLCNRGTHDEPLEINAMEQFIGDFAIDAGLSLARVDAADPRTETVGVVGAGPSGLSFAYQVARRGYPVTVYEARPLAGGMLRYGIPDYRLPPAILDAEIARILDLGVELQLGTRVGVDVTLDDLRARHDMVYLAIGAQLGRVLGIPGEDGGGVWTGTDYLERVNTGASVRLGARVVVVGGGNTAVDAARTARRSGAQVTLLYRRSRAEMPAISEEVDEAVEEGVGLLLQAAPVRLERRDGGVVCLIAERVELGVPDSSGRRSPISVPGSEFMIPLDSLIAAVSQEHDLAGFEGVLVDGHLRAHDGVIEAHLLAGGDVLAQGIAGQAIAQGRLAAEAMAAGLRAPGILASAAIRRRAAPASLLKDFFSPASARRRRPIAAAERVRSTTAEVKLGLTEPEFLAEIARCMSCGSCFGCEQCAMYCTVGSFHKLGDPEPGRYFAMTLDECLECGKCVSVCPSGYLEIAPRVERSLNLAV